MIFVICMIEDDKDKNSILIFKLINHINQINHSSDELKSHPPSIHSKGEKRRRSTSKVDSILKTLLTQRIGRSVDGVDVVTNV